MRIEGNTVFAGDEPVAHGSLQDAESVGKAMADAREGLSVQLEAFAANTMEYLRQERDLLLDGVGVPDIETQIAGSALPDRGARLRLQGRPGRAAPVHPGVQAGAHRRRRRRGRPGRGRLHPRHDHRGHGFGHRRRAALRRRGDRARVPGRAGARPAPGQRPRCAGDHLPGGGDQRGSGHAARRREGRLAASSRSAPTPPSSSSSTRAAAGWPRRS